MKSKLALVLPLALLASCETFAWEGRQGETDGIPDIAQLADSYETQSFWREVRRRSDGRVNAFSRDLGRIGDFWDRHFLNYSANDPNVNYPTDQGRVEAFGRFLVR